MSKDFKQHGLEWTGNKCMACECDIDEDSCEVDHVYPKIKGGTLELGNVGILCIPCNRIKKDELLSVLVIDRPEFDGYRQKVVDFTKYMSSGHLCSYSRLYVMVNKCGEDYVKGIHLIKERVDNDIAEGEDSAAAVLAMYLGFKDAAKERARGGGPGNLSAPVTTCIKRAFADYGILISGNAATLAFDTQETYFEKRLQEEISKIDID